MINRFFSLNSDFAGAITAAVCAIHCSIFPILLSFGFISSAGHNHIFDWVFISIGIVIAGYTLVKDYNRNHKNKKPLIIAITGFSLLIFGIETHVSPILNVSGGLLIILSHYYNYKYSNCKKCIY
ncbi:MAG: MerC domain-containing protein [Saprospiraceae bacterium]